MSSPKNVRIAIAIAWAGLMLAYFTDWPTSFFITALGAGAYLVAAIVNKSRAG